MATGSQGNATGLALKVVEFVRMELIHRDMTIENLAKAAGLSNNYLATRLRGERLLNLRDFESIAAAFGLDPQEMLARVEFPAARGYEGRLVPLYGVTMSQKLGEEIYRTEDADPPVRVGGVPDAEETRRQSDYRRAADQTEESGEEIDTI